MQCIVIFSDDLRNNILDFRRMKGRVENDIFCTGHIIGQRTFECLLCFEIKAFVTNWMYVYDRISILFLEIIFHVI